MIAEQRDIFLVPFPYSDFSDRKVRPVLILSKDTFNTTSEDVIICAITSTLSKDPYSLLITSKDLEEGHLFMTSAVKMENILKIDKKLLIKKIGKLKKDAFSNVIKIVSTLF